MINELVCVLAAEGMSKKAHEGQIDKSGKDYFTAHVYPIAKKMELDGYSEEYVATAYLHDVVEDTDVSVIEIEAIFGGRIAYAVHCISRNEEETYEEYLVRVKSNKIAKRVKYYDIQNNLAPGRMDKLDEKTRTRLKKKYAKALAFLAAP
jgi:(p)ppGpp synthase/HD superfamily hydrolase